MAEAEQQHLLLSSMISDIKNYTGDDPLRPWLRGIRRMKQSLPPQIYNQKLPRFLQKCVQTFQNDRLYRNDTRYIQIWIQLMDLVEDPHGLLRKMEMNKIGAKKALFYQAYALYYERRKKYDEAEKMYHLGVNNLAQPVEQLKKTYFEFLERMAQRKKKKAQRNDLKAGNMCKSILRPPKKVGESREGICNGDSSRRQEVLGATKSRSFLKPLACSDKNSSKESSFCSDETVVGKFVGTAIVGKCEAEDACHHGLVDPTINLKEAMNAINSMFREPIDIEPVRRRKLNKGPTKVEEKMASGFEVFVDEGSDDGEKYSGQNKENGDVPHIAVASNPVKEARLNKIETRKPLQETFQIFVDDEEGSGSSEGNGGGFVFLTPTDDSDEEVAESAPRFEVAETAPRLLRREDTVVGRFVGSTILDDHVEVENACHHGLVEPTVNMKEAMDDINGMFGKPLDFGRATRPKKLRNLPNKKKDYGGFSILPDDNMEQQQQAQLKKQGKLPDMKMDCGGFSILPDDDLEHQQQPQEKKQVKLPNNKMDFGAFSILPDDDMEQQPQLQLKKQEKLPNKILPDDDVVTKQPQPASSCAPRSDSEYDLHEPTVFTKQALDDINEMFGKPLW
ncbi:hypothetical protein MKW94_018574 [Papaver nudicaule]|uniref:BUB1 N-terminal domain-containing protein n=1 Tax=Papaver nudicaule TaxID=74823 RepID=A0AA41SA96_PAPNU|nr:hypothetical protein [Papaver nudicaule]